MLGVKRESGSFALELAFFHTSLQYQSNGVKFVCPLCRMREIILYFLEEKVMNCSGTPIDERFPVVCPECQAKLENQAIFEDSTTNLFIEKALGVKICE